MVCVCSGVIVPSMIFAKLRKKIIISSSYFSNFVWYFWRGERISSKYRKAGSKEGREGMQKETPYKKKA